MNRSATSSTTARPRWRARVRSAAELKDAIRRTAGAATVFFKDTTDRAREDVIGDAGFLRSVRHTAVCAAGCTPAAVVDADDLLDRPEATLAAWCRAVGLPFLPQALRWSAGARPEWSRSGRWHTGVAESSGFERRRAEYDRTVANTPALGTFAAHHEPYYRRLRAVRLRIAAEAAASRLHGAKSLCSRIWSDGQPFS